MERHIAYVVAHHWLRSAADYTCNRCDRLYSAEYVRLQTTERRVYRAETGYRPVLEHAPSRLEAYTLCIRCSNKPFTGYSARQPLQRS
jgi:hypothetical protein